MFAPMWGRTPGPGFGAPSATGAGVTACPWPPLSVRRSIKHRLPSHPTGSCSSAQAGGARGGAGVWESLPGPGAGGRYLVLLRVVSDGLQVTHQELECLVIVTWQVPDLQGGTRSPLSSTPHLSHPCQPQKRGSGLCPPPQPLPHLPTSFRSVLILSLASSIRLASMKSLYLSESGTWRGQSWARGEGTPRG